MISTTATAQDLSERLERFVRDTGPVMLSEVATRASTWGYERARTESALGCLEHDGRIVIAHPSSNDPHFADADLRAVAAVDPERPEGRTEAYQRAMGCWTELARTFLLTHRCGSFGCAPSGSVS